jgi:hypothetical protein
VTVTIAISVAATVSTSVTSARRLMLCARAQTEATASEECSVRGDFGRVVVVDVDDDFVVASDVDVVVDCHLFPYPLWSKLMKVVWMDAEALLQTC